MPVFPRRRAGFRLFVYRRPPLPPGKIQALGGADYMYEING